MENEDRIDESNISGASLDAMGPGMGSEGIGTGTAGLGTGAGKTESGLGGVGSDMSAWPGTGGLGHTSDEDAPIAGPGVSDGGVGNGAGVGVPGAGLPRATEDDELGQVPAAPEPGPAPINAPGQGPGGASGEDMPKPTGPGPTEIGGPTET